MARRLLLADDHTLMLEGLTRLLSTDFEIAGTAADGRTMLAEAERLQPDAVVLDIGMPDMNGIEAANRLNKLLPAAKIVIVTQQLDQAYVHAAFTVGAKAYVSKQSASTELVNAIHRALEGRYYVSPQVGADAVKFIEQNPGRNPSELFGGRLTPRQREVLQLVAEGKTSKEISGLLKISLKTVEFHRNCLMDELGLRSTAELTRYALSHGIIS
jgi:DNA-binding NarL/FixJ family response regulator